MIAQSRLIPVAETPAPAPSPRVWIVVAAKSGQEIRAKAELERQGFETYLPMRLFEDKKGQLKSRPFLAPYLFAHVPLHVSEWRCIFSTYGVAGVLGCSSRRTYGLKDSVIERIKAQEEGGYIRLGLASDEAPARYSKGQRVRCDDLIDAMFLERVDSHRAVILVSLLGVESPQTVDIRRLAATL